MSQVQELKSIPMSKGSHMRLFIDHSQPEGSLNKRWTECVYDGRPESVVFEIPAHWHKDHDETMTVLEGEADMTIDGVTTRIRVGDAPITVFRRQTHSLKCIPGVRFVLKEFTDPTGEFKEWFFRDFFLYGNPTSFLWVMRAFWDGDCYPALPPASPLLDQVVLCVFGSIAKLIMPAKKPLQREPWPAMQQITVSP